MSSGRHGKTTYAAARSEDLCHSAVTGERIAAGKPIKPCRSSGDRPPILRACQNLEELVPWTFLDVTRLTPHISLRWIHSFLPGCHCIWKERMLKMSNRNSERETKNLRRMLLTIEEYQAAAERRQQAKTKRKQAEVEQMIEAKVSQALRLML